VTPGQLYVHKKSGRIYTVLRVAGVCTNKREDAYDVVYERLGKKVTTYTRELNEFCDGRFTLIHLEHIERLVKKDMKSTQ
jgi:hypothetical protein